MSDARPKAPAPGPGQPAAHAHAHAPRLGHPGRMRLPGKARFLISAQLIVFALSLEDEELVEMMADAWALSHTSQILAEVVLSLLLLIAWGFLTLGWVRLAYPRGCPREGEE